MKDQAVCILR